MASCIYYDAFLTDVTTEERMDSVSTLGYGLGYIGGSTIPLLIFLIMNAVGVPMLTCLGFIFGLTAVWWLVFSLPLLKNVRADHRQALREGRGRRRHQERVYDPEGDRARTSRCFVYIVAYFFYIDGVHTIIQYVHKLRRPTWGWIPPVCCWRCCWCRCWACRSAFCT